MFSGFLESGKTLFIKDNLEDPEFADGGKILLICCEQGIEEYDEELLSSSNTSVVEIDTIEDLTSSFFKECQEKYKPGKVIVEYNGMWQIEPFLEICLPKRWILVQTITTVAEPTFELYMNNMRSLMVSHLTNTDMVIFNRCNEKTKKPADRRAVKAVNKRAQIYFEAAPGCEFGTDEEDMPFDINADIIEILDDDFGLWYLDAMDNPKKYEGKKVKIKGMVYKSRKLPKGCFVPGRFAMTCCADDIAFLGILCHAEDSLLLGYANKAWVNVTAVMRCEYQREYQGDGPVLYAEMLEPAQQPEEELVYFN